MSFWDRIKPAQRTSAVTDARLADDGRTLHLTWDDGQRTVASARTLRQACPCAGCVDEWTHQRTLNTDAVPVDLRISELQPVGNYALSMVFGDGHRTGIFTWPHLREHSRPPS